MLNILGKVVFPKKVPRDISEDDKKKTSFTFPREAIKRETNLKGVVEREGSKKDGEA